MTQLYSAEMQKVANNLAGLPMDLPKSALLSGKTRWQVATIALAAQTTSDVIHIARIPKGAVLLGFLMNTDTSLGSSTIAFGNAHSGNSAKYKAAAAFTATDTPTWVMKAAGAGLDLSLATCYDINDKDSPYEDIIITIAAATMPASGRFVVATLYATE